MDVKSNALDATHYSHDRDFGTIDFFLNNTLESLGCGCLRIFDVGRGAGGYDVAAHVFANEGGGFWPGLF